jgi:hypothetical protein
VGVITAAKQENAPSQPALRSSPPIA